MLRKWHYDMHEMGVGTGTFGHVQSAFLLAPGIGGGGCSGRPFHQVALTV